MLSEKEMEKVLVNFWAMSSIKAVKESYVEETEFRTAMNLIRETKKACQEKYDLLYNNFDKYRQDHKEKCVSKSDVLKAIEKQADILWECKRSREFKKGWDYAFNFLKKELKLEGVNK